jgi:hypothetical protein
VKDDKEKWDSIKEIVEIICGTIIILAFLAMVYFGL